MNRELFMMLLWFMAGIIVGYLLQPAIEFIVWVLIYKVGEGILDWLYEKGIIK